MGVILLGACVGSFLNVLIYRLPLEPGVDLGPRSVCPKCRARIAWYDNIPVLSWILLRGRARCCKARISFRYPFVEALTAVAFALLWVFPPSGHSAASEGLTAAVLLGFALHAFFVANLIANTFIDIDHRILPDALTLSGVVVGLIGSLLLPGLAGLFPSDGNITPAANSLMFSGLGALVGSGLTWGVRWLGTKVFKKEAMGLGDVKLMAMIGAFVGWNGAVLSLLLGSVLGALVGTLHQIRSGDSSICFGPFLAAGALLALLWRAELIEFFTDSLPALQQRHPSLSWVMLVVATASLVLLFVLIRRGRRS